MAPELLPFTSTRHPRLGQQQTPPAPDALVACNAGLASYREWFPVIYDVHAQHIPFATTEYAEQSAEAPERRDAFDAEDDLRVTETSG